MNNIINAIRLALFGGNVDSIVKSFNAHRDALEKLAGRLNDHAAQKRQAADRLQAEAAAHGNEAERATRVAKRVADLLR